mmetsp:Transcript_33873/g.32966  ORF Transcript_33873/g.32966 Transcript_33873/m.32966 type:complete len:118 (-) Transcript_33873:1623-1976(-)
MGFDQFEDQKQVDVIMISHKYDTTSLYLTLPDLYESYESPDEYERQCLVLNEVMEIIQKNTMDIPEMMLPIDQTNRYPWGKIMVEVQNLKNFPFFNNLFVRITCNPWVLGTRRVLDT